MKKKFLLILVSAMFLTSIFATNALAVLIDDFDDGDLAGWSVNGSVDASSGVAAITGLGDISMDTGYDFVSGESYTVGADVTGGDSMIILFAGSSWLGTSFTSSLTYTADAGTAGQSIVLYLKNRDKDPSSSITTFDNVYLDSSAFQVASTGGETNTMHNPIPAPILLLGTGLVGLAGFRRKIKK